MQFIRGRRYREGWRGAVLTAAKIAAAAGMMALVGVAGTYRPAQAADSWITWEPAVPYQGAACLARGIQVPIDAQGGAVPIRYIDDGNVRTERTPIHQVTLDSDGSKVNNFCININERILDNRPYCQEGVAPDPRLAYIINKYPPSLTDREAQAARQAAVWHYTNAIDLIDPDATTEGPAVDAAVLGEYKAILADVEANVNPEDPPAQLLPGPLALSVLPTDAIHVLPNSKDHDFVVTLTNGGKPLEGITITVSSTFGTLDRSSGVTDSAGEAAFKLTSSQVGRANIAASAAVTLPVAKIYVSEVDPTGEQDIAGPWSLSENLSVQAAATWITPTALTPEGEPGSGWLLFLPAIKD
jgi:hypothetical protein